jgi:predicted phage terminase large subunit-like protein
MQLAAATPATVRRSPTKFDIERKLASRHLRDFMEFFVWPVCEPGTPYVGGWHIDAVCEHLEAVTLRQIRNLLILIPPRHTKSLCSSVGWPAWVWTQYPERRFLSASFSQGLSTDHAVLSRRVIESPRYQRAFGHLYQLSTDQNVKTHYENSKRGIRLATSVGGGSGLGQGGDYLLADDPNDLLAIHKEAERLGSQKWYREVWSSRFNDPKTGCRVVIMQRGHQDDLAGYLIKEGDYEVLSLPTEYVPTKHVTSIGWRDPRTKPGELLNPNRFGPVEVAKIKKELTATTFATQHQQRPTPAEGALFKRANLQVITAEQLPRGVSFIECRAWDCAATEEKPGKDPDATAGVKMRFYENGLIVVAHVVRGFFGPHEGDSVLRATAVADGRLCRQREEQEPGSAGKKIVATHVKLLRGFDYKGEPSSGDKQTRAKPFAVQVEAGNVRLLAGPWNEGYIDELILFPNGRYDDQVDGSSTSFNELATGPLPASEVEVKWG